MKLEVIFEIFFIVRVLFPKSKNTGIVISRVSFVNFAVSVRGKKYEVGNSIPFLKTNFYRMGQRSPNFSLDYGQKIFTNLRQATRVSEKLLTEAPFSISFAQYEYICTLMNYRELVYFACFNFFFSNSRLLSSSSRGPCPYRL